MRRVKLIHRPATPGGASLREQMRHRRREPKSPLYIRVMEAALPSDHLSVKRILVALLLVVLIPAGQLMSGNPAHAATPSAVLTGIVTAADTGASIEGVQVQLFTFVSEGQTELAASGTTGTDGVFLIDNLQPTTYVITFTAPSSDYVATTEQFFEVLEGENRLDQILERSATVSGTVIAETAEGAPAVIPGVRVNLIPVGDLTSSVGADADENGRYTITGILSGTYDVEFNGSQEIETHLTSYLGGALDREDAEKLVLESGEGVAGVDATLILGSSIGGRITGSDGVTQTGASAAIFRQTTDGTWQSEKALQGSTDASGDYTVVGLRPGAYKIGFLNRYEGSGQYLPEYFDDRATLETATILELALRENVEEISATLERVGSEPASPAPPPSAFPAAPETPGEGLAATGTATRLAPFAAALVLIGLSLLITHRTAARSSG